MISLRQSTLTAMANLVVTVSISSLLGPEVIDLFEAIDIDGDGKL